MKKVYISAPISGYDIAERREFFGKVQKALEERGYEVFNPLEGVEDVSLPHEVYMKQDIKALLDCDAVLFCGTFGASDGCRTEFAVAGQIGLQRAWLQDNGKCFRLESDPHNVSAFHNTDDICKEFDGLVKRE